MIRPAGPEPRTNLKIDAGLARFQTHGGRGKRLFSNGRGAPVAARGAARLSAARAGGALGPSRARRRFGPRLAGRRRGRLQIDGLRRLAGGSVRDFAAAGMMRIGQARRVDANELGADGQHVPDRAAEREHAACDGGRDFDRRLVGHDGGDDLILPDEIADLDRPLDDLGFRDPFADVGHLDRAHAHL